MYQSSYTYDTPISYNIKAAPNTRMVYTVRPQTPSRNVMRNVTGVKYMDLLSKLV